MALTPDQIVEEASRLSPEGLAEVVDRLLWSLHGGQTVEESQAWSDLARRRLGDIEGGRVPGVPGDVTSAKIRQSLGR